MRPSPRRIIIMGCTCAGKSTLAKRLSQEAQVPCVELDALNWEANWHSLAEHNPNKFKQRIQEATASDSWIVAGSYTQFSQELLWPRAQLLIFLDLPRAILTFRILRRAWHRWRTKELLWGTNYERFWPHLKIWSSDSLIYWLWTTHPKRIMTFEKARENPDFSHLGFVHLTTQTEIKSFQIGRKSLRDNREK